MPTLKDLRSHLQNHFLEFDKIFNNSFQSKVPLLNKITKYLVKRKGKQMRPMFVFFIADICGEINESTYRSASLIELLHTATLVHDDVVDDSNFRRGLFSINAIWKNKIAVLLGDYLLSRGLLLSIENDEAHLLKIVSKAVREMSEGELLQIEKARKLDIEESVYYKIITQKTASLIAACCAVGAASVGASTETIEKMRQFGEYVGIAFQIKDDLFDFQVNNKTGKPSGVDIKEQKMTLPLIYLLNNVSSKEKRKIINIVKNNNNDDEKVKYVINMVNNSGGINYATEAMYKYLDKAMEIIKSFPDSKSKESLITLVKYTAERSK
ncbi:MAG: polyprenyl synthetase family protein [Hyphomicrobiales bacterium]